MHADALFIPLFMKFGVDLDASNSQGCTALMNAAMCGEIELLRSLLDSGADSEVINAKNQNALVVAVEAGQTEAVRTLLERGVSITPPEGHGWIAVILAAAAGDLTRIRECLDGGGLIHAKTSQNESAMDWADKMGYLPVRQLLRSRGATTEET